MAAAGFSSAGRLAPTTQLPAVTDAQRCSANGAGCCAGLAGAEGEGAARRRLLQACFSLGGPLLPPRACPRWATASAASVTQRAPRQLRLVLGPGRQRQDLPGLGALSRACCS